MNANEIKKYIRTGFAGKSTAENVIFAIETINDFLVEGTISPKTYVSLINWTSKL